MKRPLKAAVLFLLVSLSSLFIFSSQAYPQDSIMGQIQFVVGSKAAKSSGIWIDGQYVGYLAELGGSSRVRLLPGEHQVTIRQAGYDEFNQKAIIEPGKILDIHVDLKMDPRFQYPEPKTSSVIKLDVRPDRAAVFLDDNFVGHVEEYYGSGRGMLVTPGKHRIKIALGGYRAFETEVNLLPRQKFTLKTELIAGSINDADPLIRTERSTASAQGAGAAAR